MNGIPAVNGTGKRTRVKPGWHKTPQDATTRRLKRIAREDKRNARFWR